MADGALDVLAVAMDANVIRWITKPLIVPLLIGFYFSSASSPSMPFVAALFFCWLGDVLLMLQTPAELFFIAGLSAFLAGHLLYILVYRQLRWNAPINPWSGVQKMRASFPVILAGTGLIVILFPHLNGMEAPVILYACVLMAMVIAALLRSGYTHAQSFSYIVAGACSFMISDSLLAINKFLTPIPAGGILVMLTYICAQYLIAKGVLLHRNSA